MRLLATSGARFSPPESDATASPVSRKPHTLRLTFAFLLLILLAACAKNPILNSASDPRAKDPEALSRPQPFIRSSGHQGEVWALDFDSTGRLLYSAGADKTVRVWDTEKEEQIQQFYFPTWRGNDGALHDLDVAPNDRWLAVGGCQGCSRSFPDDDSFMVYMVDTDSGQVIDSVGLNGSLHALGFSPDGKFLATGGFPGVLRFWRVESDGTLFEDATMPGHNASISDLAWFPNSDRIVTVGYDGLLAMWSRHPVGGWFPEWTTTFNVRLRDVAVSPNESWVLVVSENGRLELISAEDGEIVQTLVEIPKGFILDARFSADGETSIYSSATTKGGADTGIGRISIPGGGAKIFGQSKEYVHTLAWSGNPDSLIAAATSYGEIQLRDPHSLSQTGALLEAGIARYWLGSRNDLVAWRKVGEEEASEAFDTRSAVAVDIESESESGFTAAADPRIDFQMNQPIPGHITTFSGFNLWRSFQATSDSISTWSFLDGSVVAVGTTRELAIVDLKNETVLTCNGHLSGILALTRHRAGELVVSIGIDRTIRFWNSKTCELLASFYSDPSGEWVAWTPQGYFKTSEKGGDLLGFLTNHGTRQTPMIEDSTDHPDLHRPDIVERTLANGTFDEPSGISKSESTDVDDDVVEEPLNENASP